MEPLEMLQETVIEMGLDNVSWLVMEPYWQPVHFGRKQLITREGDIEKYVYFVTEGIQRAYVEKEGKESILVFSYKGSFSGIIDSFFMQAPSKYNLETITRSHMLRIHYNDFSRLIEEHRPIEKFIRLAVTGTLAGTLERNIELLSLSAEERFLKLLKRSPHVLNMIPHKYLAAYIGVDPATFSKLLATVRL